MNRPWWSLVFQWGIWLVVMSLVMGWVARSRLKSRPLADARKLVQPTSTLIVGLACFVFFGGIAVLSNVYSNKTTTWWTTGLFVGFALMGLTVIADYLFARHEVSETGIRFGRIFGSRGTMLWSELQSVRYAPGMKWFRLESRNGKVARISAALQGLPEFARLVLAQAPTESIEPSARDVLKATADGSPPPVW